MGKVLALCDGRNTNGEMQEELSQKKVILLRIRDLSFFTADQSNLCQSGHFCFHDNGLFLMWTSESLWLFTQVLIPCLIVFNLSEPILALGPTIP